ncbi:MAG: phosphatase PAP2 family protein [Cytophagaceae bacterium]
MKSLYSKLSAFYLCSAVYFIVVGCLVIVFPKGVIELGFNQYHHPLLDSIFYYATYLGDGYLAAYILISILVFFNIRIAVSTTVALLFTSAIVQILKHWFFYDVVRPTLHITKPLYTIPGLDIHKYHSFPSGHTAQAFALAICLAYYSASKKLSVVLFMLAVLTALSRVYLMQHFLLDTFAGGLIAIICCSLFFHWTQKFETSGLAQKSNRPLWN